MLYANFNSDEEVELVERNKVADLNNLATYDELIDEACCGLMEFTEVMRIQDGIVFWDEEEVEVDFMEFIN